MPPALFYFLRIALAILGLSWFHINFRIIYFSSVKSVMVNLIGVTLNVQGHKFLNIGNRNLKLQKCYT